MLVEPTNSLHGPALGPGLPGQCRRRGIADRGRRYAGIHVGRPAAAAGQVFLVLVWWIPHRERHKRKRKRRRGRRKRFLPSHLLVLVAVLSPTDGSAIQSSVPAAEWRLSRRPRSAGGRRLTCRWRASSCLRRVVPRPVRRGGGPAVRTAAEPRQLHGIPREGTAAQTRQEAAADAIDVAGIDVVVEGVQPGTVGDRFPAAFAIAIAKLSPRRSTRRLLLPSSSALGTTERGGTH